MLSDRVGRSFCLNKITPRKILRWNQTMFSDRVGRNFCLDKITPTTIPRCNKKND